MINRLIEVRRNIFKPQIINIINKEWLYMLGMETRNSIMIEGIFVDEDELEAVVVSGKSKSNSEAYNYFKTAKYYYNLAIEFFKTKENVPCLSLVRNTHRILFENIISSSQKLGDFRIGPVRITGAKIQPPEYDISDWIKLWCSYAEYVFLYHPVHEAAARLHVFFESIHPFEDGNGRIGRILLNFLLITHGYINIVIKGEKEKDRNNYIKSLEQSERGLRNIFKNGPSEYTAEKIDSLFNKNETKTLSSIIAKAIIESYDRLICTKNKNNLITVSDYSKITGKKEETIRKMIERKKLIAYKPKGRWLIYPVEI
jgi:Fic family protein